MVCRGSMPLSNMFLNLVLFYSPFTFEEKTTLAGKQKQKASLIHVDLRKYLELMIQSCNYEPLTNWQQAIYDNSGHCNIKFDILNL